MSESTGRAPAGPSRVARVSMYRPVAAKRTPFETVAKVACASSAWVSAARACTTMADPAGSEPCGSVFHRIVPHVCPATPLSWTTVQNPCGDVLPRATNPVMSL